MIYNLLRICAANCLQQQPLQQMGPTTVAAKPAYNERAAYSLCRPTPITVFTYAAKMKSLSHYENSAAWPHFCTPCTTTADVPYWLETQSAHTSNIFKWWASRRHFCLCYLGHVGHVLLNFWSGFIQNFARERKGKSGVHLLSFLLFPLYIYYLMSQTYVWYGEAWVCRATGRTTSCTTYWHVATLSIAVDFRFA